MSTLPCRKRLSPSTGESLNVSARPSGERQVCSLNAPVRVSNT